MPKAKKSVQKKAAPKKSTKTRRKVVKTQHFDITYIIVPVFAAVVLICLGLLAISARANQTLYNPESENTSIKQVPPEIKQKILAASPAATFRVPVLMYHYVEFVQDKNDITRQKLNTNPPIFDSQIDTLKNAGYHFLTASDLADVLDGFRKLPSKPVLITFDDGHRDFYTDAFPIIKKYQIHVTQYVISGFLGGSDFMTPKQVTAIAKSGLVEVGDHTVNHIWMKGESRTKDEFEVKNSKQKLEKLTGQKIVSFAYPYGAFDSQAEDVVKNAGFRTAVSTIPGNEVNQDNRFFIFRIRPGNMTGQELLNFLENTNYNPYK